MKHKTVKPEEKPIESKPSPEDTTKENEEEQIPDHIIFIDPETGERILPRWLRILVELPEERKKKLKEEIEKLNEELELRWKYFGNEGKTIN